MSSEVSEHTLESLCLLVADCPHATPKWTDSGVIVLRNQNIKEGRLDLSSPSYTDEAHYLGRIRRAAPQQGDIVITREAPMGDVCQIPAGLKCCLGQRQVLLRPNPVKVDSRFLLYALQSPYLQHQIGWNEGTGSTVSNLRIPVLEALRVPTPSLESQREIATTLGALDDRITLLRETNATLEAIAQALFKSWFVDFDPVRAKMEGRTPEGMDEATAALLPDGFETSELGEVPRGWRSAALKDCCIKVESGGTPKRTVPEYWNGTVSWLTSGEVRSAIVFDTKEQITMAGLTESSAKLWPSGTTVVAMYGATAGEVCLIASPMSANQACCGLIPKQDFRAFLFFATRRDRESLASKSSGSAQQNLNKGLVEAHPICLPSLSVAVAFEEAVGTLLDRWIANEQQAQTLSTLRNTLLPRLISGQLRLPEAQAATEAALGGVSQA